MALPFNLQKLPSEMLTVLRYLGAQNGVARTYKIQTDLQMSERLVLRAIRRLVNYNLIGMDANGAYQITSEGKRAYQQLLNAGDAPSVTETEDSKPKVGRRLTAVVPGVLTYGQPAALFIGIDPPAPGVQLPEPVQVDLRLTVLGGTLNPLMTSLTVPPNAAAQPIKIMLTAHVVDKPVRVRVDAYQTVGVAELEPAGGMYFDIPVAATGTPPLTAGKRAVAVTLELMQE